MLTLFIAKLMGVIHILILCRKRTGSHRRYDSDSAMAMILMYIYIYNISLFYHTVFITESPLDTLGLYQLILGGSSLQ